MTNKLVTTDFGLISDNVDALVTTDNSGTGLLIVGGQSYVVTRTYGMSVEPIKSRSERVFEKLAASFDHNFVAFCEMFTFKKYKENQKNYWEQLNKNRALEAELKDLKRSIAHLPVNLLEVH